MKLTKRQTEILFWVKQAHSNKAIAKRLGITECTVKLHISALLKKHQAKNRQQLVLFTTNNIIPNLPPLEAKPYAWIKNTGSFMGVAFNKQPDSSWVAVYRKK